MSVHYQPVLWNRQKIIYDAILLIAVGIYLYLFMTVPKWIDPDIKPQELEIRAFGSAALILLHIILSIGPLSRFNSKFLPLLYNRRHMGVTMFLLALYHAHLAIDWYHDLGNLDPYVSLFVSNTHFFSFFRFPFEILGFLGLCILFLMAATSHDFWLANLTAPVWKALHMFVYLAYGLLVAHVVLGALQTNQNILLSLAVGIGLIWIVTIHLMAGIREYQKDQKILTPNQEGFVEVGDIEEIPENRAKVVCLSGERVAVFKYDGKISAVSNVCQHQNGPLGEGKIVDGCITCPWHGYQYLPESGASPPPFTEKIPTFEVKLENNRIFVKAIPNRLGTSVTPAVIT
jgi:nitrite reductase/ring-hydroxylating ferredoxin subunit/DMSO/TMAO reductase YedYZ heme-binding membrane subunit